MSTKHFDVVIVGGGPAGSTCGTLLKKYAPELKVAIVEKESFPREHVGESQLPAIGTVLTEMGVWDKVEAANFIIKLGATYTWGKTTHRGGHASCRMKFRACAKTSLLRPIQLRC